MFWSALGELYLLVSYYNLPNLDHGQNMLPSKYSITFNLVKYRTFHEKNWLLGAWSKKLIATRKKMVHVFSSELKKDG